MGILGVKLMRKTLVLLMVLAASAALTACGPKKQDAPADANAGQQTGAGAAGAGANSASGEEGAEAPGPLEGMLAKRTIYFDFDSSEIRGEGTDIVAAHAKYLAANGGMKVRLEGHTDERGSREYNIGLGERRAQAVRRALLLQGASEGQLSTVSYGEERPAAAGSDEAAWTKNRRVEIVYLQ
jgi:peptidoglycan-associated lipoprotein